MGLLSSNFGGTIFEARGVTAISSSLALSKFLLCILTGSFVSTTIGVRVNSVVGERGSIPSSFVCILGVFDSSAAEN